MPRTVRLDDYEREILSRLQKPKSFHDLHFEIEEDLRPKTVKTRLDRLVARQLVMEGRLAFKITGLGRKVLKSRHADRGESRPPK